MLVTGQTLVIDITNDAGDTVSFVANPECHEGLHAYPLDALIEHFEIPDVPDVVTADPDGYATYKHRLLALER